MDVATLELVEEFGHKYEEFGLSYNLGRVFGLCLLAGRAMSQEELAETLGISQSVVSTSVRTLTTIGMLNKLRVPGSRAAAYEASDQMEGVFLASARMRAAVMLDLFRQARSLELEGDARERVERFHAFITFMDRRIAQILEEWRNREELA